MRSFGFGIDAVIAAVGDFVDYRRQQARFEADERVRAEVERFRAGLFAAGSAKSCETVRDLAVTKAKLRLLRQKVSRLSADVQAVFDPLLTELQERIEELRKRRKTL